MTTGTSVSTPHGEFVIKEHPAVPADRPHVIGCVSRRTRIPSFLIRFFTLGARWSHIGCVDVERGFVLEALFGDKEDGTEIGVVPTPIDKWLRRYPSSEFFRTDCPEPEKALEFWRKAADENWEYDEGGAFSTVFRSTRFDDPDAVWCGELWERGLAAGGRQRFRLDGVRYPPMESWNIL